VIGMARLVVDDPAVVAKFDAVEGRSEIFDSSGRALGLFVRYHTRDGVTFGAKSSFSKKEIERRYREGTATARPLSEFFDEMERRYPGEFKRP
jgi:hypothetical protein